MTGPGTVTAGEEHDPTVCGNHPCCAYLDASALQPGFSPCHKYWRHDKQRVERSRLHLAQVRAGFVGKPSNVPLQAMGTPSFGASKPGIARAVRLRCTVPSPAVLVVTPSYAYASVPITACRRLVAVDGGLTPQWCRNSRL